MTTKKTDAGVVLVGGEAGEGGSPFDVDEPAFVFAPGGLGSGGEVEKNVRGGFAKEGPHPGFVIYGNMMAIPGDRLNVLRLEMVGKGDAETARGAGEESFCSHMDIFNAKTQGFSLCSSRPSW